MFAISNSAGYAIRALSCLEQASGRWVLSKNIASCTGIPHPYLLKILHQLHSASLVVSKSGYSGGYRLARPAETLTLWEIAAVVDGPQFLSGCLLGLASCSDDRSCPTHEFWKKERNRIEQALRTMSLARVADFEWKWLYLEGNTCCGVQGAIPKESTREQHDKPQD